MFLRSSYDVIVIGGGHAGAEAAHAAAKVLEPHRGEVLLLTMDPSKTGAMSCNPCIGGLAKGQVVREIDALGGIMGLAADATGIQFRMLNASKGPAVHGPRCQSDKYAYAREVRRLLAMRENLTHAQGLVDDFLVEDGRCVGVVALAPPEGDPRAARWNTSGDCCAEAVCRPERAAAASEPMGPHWRRIRIRAKAVVLTTGTFMRALMHTGPERTPGGRVGEGTADGVSGALARLGFDLHRLKTGTPPRLRAGSIDFAALTPQWGDAEPVPFSDLTVRGFFPKMRQVACHETHTTPEIHELLRAHLHEAPMYNGQIGSSGPRYCPSIEDKVVRFADKGSHHVYLEPESLETDEIYCNGVSTSLPRQVQERMIRLLPGCEKAEVLRWAYAVEYDSVKGHQLDATCESKPLPGLFTAGQLNGTSGYEEAAGQGLMAGLNAARLALGQEPVRLGRGQAYIGVMLDDLCTKIPLEPYRLFTSRAEWRLCLRADNSDERLTALGRQWGLVDDIRWGLFGRRQQAKETLRACFRERKVEAAGATGSRRVSLADWARRPEATLAELRPHLEGAGLPAEALEPRVLSGVWSENLYSGYLDRQRMEIERLHAQEEQAIPRGTAFDAVPGLRREAAVKLAQFQPATLGQAGRLEGVNPTDVMNLAVWLDKRRPLA